MGTRDVTFTSDGTWTAPAGVKRITVTGIQGPWGLQTQMTGLIDQYGRAYMMGFGSAGELGDGTSTTKSSPVLVTGGLTWIRIARGQFQSGFTNTGIATNGKAYAWGENQDGELGDGTRTNRSSPTPLIGGLLFRDLRVAQTPFGGAVLAITVDNKLYGSGENSLGILGNGDLINRSSPTLVVGGLTFQKVEMIGNGTQGTALGLTTSGAMYSWGDASGGILGNNTTTSTSSPVPVVGGYTFVDFALADSTAFGLQADGTIYAWGSGNAGQIGDNNATSRSSPVPVAGTTKFKAIFPSRMSNNVWALSKSGVLYGWGDNFAGTVGDGNNSTGTSSPVPVAGGYKFVKVVSSGTGESTTAVVGLASDGNIYGWGNNDKGAVGDGTTTTRSSPILIVGGYKFVDIASTMALDASFLAVTTNGRVYAWGANVHGELGVGDVVARSSPTLVVGELQAMTAPVATTTYFNVVPNTTYTITKNSFLSLFNGSYIGTQLDKIVITYEQ